MVKVVEKNVRPRQLTVSPLTDFTLSGSYVKKMAFTYSVAIRGSKDNKYDLVGSVKVEGHDYYVVDMPDSNNSLYGVLVDNDNNLFQRMILNDDHDYLMNATGSMLMPGNVQFRMNPETPANASADTLFRYGTTNYELVYGGVNKVALNIGYRQYTPDSLNQSFFQSIKASLSKVAAGTPDPLVQPSFTQALVYPPGAAVINFRDIKIKINEATGEKIVYTVLEDGLAEK